MTSNSTLYNFTYNSSITFKDYLSTLQNTMNIVFNRLYNSYPNYKLYPNVSETENIYVNDNYNLSSIKNSLFSFETYITKLNKDLITSINDKNLQLNSLKDINKTLNDQYSSMANTDATSIGQQVQIKEKYIEAFLSLILVIIFMIIFSLTSYKYTTGNINTKKGLNIDNINVNKTINPIGSVSKNVFIKNK